MKTSVKKSLYLSLAAVGLIAVAGTATTVNAKSYAKVTSYPALTAKATDRNVSLTGTSAIYTKAGTLKGAKVVASKTTVKKLKASTSSKKNFRVYKAAVTNRDSVYYKIVSFDKTYRGWIYGGKKANTFAGGVKSFDTLTAGTLTTEQSTKTFRITKPGTANDNKTVTYKAPAWTQYKVGRQITDSTPYAKADFNITQVGKRTREGDQWVYISAVDSANAKANGWILYSGLTTDGVTAAQGVTINYVSVDGGTVKSQILGFPLTAAADAIMNVTTTNLVIPEGYTIATWSSNATNAKRGSTVTAYVKQNAKTAMIQFKLYDKATNKIIELNATQQTALNAAEVNAAYQVPMGSSLSVATQEALLEEAGLKSFTTTDNKTATLRADGVGKIKIAGSNATPTVSAYYDVK